LTADQAIGNEHYKSNEIPPLILHRYTLMTCRCTALRKRSPCPTYRSCRKKSLRIS